MSWRELVSPIASSTRSVLRSASKLYGSSSIRATEVTVPPFARSVRVAWVLRGGVGLGALCLLLFWRSWATLVSESLVCDEQPDGTQAIVVENFDPNYLVFQRAKRLGELRPEARIIVPVQADSVSDVPNDVALGFADVMARVSRLPRMQVVSVRHVEPITLNVARQLRRFLIDERIASVTVVAPGFRSRRASLVYNRVLGSAGIVVRCVPVFGSRTPSNWTATWHGIQEVGEQFLKLQYYRFWVL
jgi:hypothetical protein